MKQIKWEDIKIGEIFEEIYCNLVYIHVKINETQTLVVDENYPFWNMENDIGKVFEKGWLFSSYKLPKKIQERYYIPEEE